MRTLMWSFRTRHFTVNWFIQDDVLDTSFMEKSLAARCRRNVDSGKWQCFMSEIQVVHNGTGICLGEANLGNSIYKNPAEFRDHFGMNAKGHGSYFSDMVREAIAEARERFPMLRDSISGVVMRERIVGTELKEAAV